MTFRIVLLTKWAHLESKLSIENISKCKINPVILRKLCTIPQDKFAESSAI